MEELNAAAAGVLTGTPQPGLRSHPLTLRQTVRHPDGTATTYTVTVQDGQVQLQPGGVDNPDVTLTTDYETAAAVAQGRLSAHAALLAGRVRVSGDSGCLVSAQETLAGAQACWDSVRARITY